MNGDLVLKPLLEPGAVTQGLFTKNLTTETALSMAGGSPADADSGERVALVEQHLLLLLTLPGPEKGPCRYLPRGRTIEVTQSLTEATLIPSSTQWHLQLYGNIAQE